MKKGVVFDLDGTLVDSLPGIARGLNLGIQALGFAPLPEEAVRKMVGRGARELCRSALQAIQGGIASEEDPLIDKILEGFMRFYPDTWQNGTIPYPGIREMLSDLKAKGFKLGVLSNKPHLVTVPLVASVFPEIGFNTVMGFSPEFPRKPDPTSLLHIVNGWGLTPDDVCMVGDSAHDGNTGKNAGTHLLLVGWGYSERKQLEDFGVPICETAESLTEQIEKI